MHRDPYFVLYHVRKGKGCAFSREGVRRSRANRGIGATLPVPEGDAAFAEIVRRQFEGHFVARQDANAIAPQPSGEVGQDYTLMFQLYAE